MAEISSDVLSGLGLTSYGTEVAKEKSDTLGQSDFLKLMTTQLSNQDPMKPMENGDFLGQMAQFSTVTGIEQLAKEFSSLSLSLNQGQALQAAALVGKNVLAPAASAELTEGQGISGAVDLPTSAGQVTVGVCDAGGQVIRSLNLGGLSVGLKEFTWDGLKDDGSAAPAGTYQFSVTAETNGASEALTTLLNGEVENVALDNGSEGLKLTVRGLGDIGFSDVRRIG